MGKVFCLVRLAEPGRFERFRPGTVLQQSISDRSTTGYVPSRVEAAHPVSRSRLRSHFILISPSHPRLQIRTNQHQNLQLCQKPLAQAVRKLRLPPKDYRTSSARTRKARHLVKIRLKIQANSIRFKKLTHQLKFLKTRLEK